MILSENRCPLFGIMLRQSILILAALAIWAQRGVSTAMKRAKSCGEPILASAFSRARPACASGERRMSLIAALSLLTIASGVPAGARKPDQKLASSVG